MTNNNPFDAESVDTDTMWAEETPETNYFKMMMQDNEAGRIAADDRDADDSVLGGATFASLMGNDKRNNNKMKKKTAPAVSYAVPHHDPSPAETLSIVGIEDDVSTIANDTVNETTKAFFSNNGTHEAVQPRIRLFKEYKTPEKAKKKKSESSTEDDETAPATPPGMIRVPGRSSSSGSPEDGAGSKESKKKSSAAPPARSRRVYIVAGVLAVILFASIIALSVALSGMRDKDGGNSATTVEESDEDILDTWPDLDTGDQGGPEDGEGDATGGDTSPSMSLAPGEGESTINPTDFGTDFGTDSLPCLTPASTFAFPTVGPTISPLQAEVAFDELFTLLLDRGVISEDIEDSESSPQYQAMVWLSEDPNFYNYLESSMIQRWALAVLAYSMDASGAQGRGRMHRGLMQGWLNYTDECTWFTSGGKDACDVQGNFHRLNIQDLQLGGSLPVEIALLSNSLRKSTMIG